MRLSRNRPVKRRGPQAGYSKLASQATSQVKYLQIILTTLLQLYPQLSDSLSGLLGDDGSGICQGLLSENEALQQWKNSPLAPWLEAKTAFDDAEDEVASAKPRKRRRSTASIAPNAEASTSQLSLDPILMADLSVPDPSPSFYKDAMLASPLESSHFNLGLAQPQWPHASGLPHIPLPGPSNPALNQLLGGLNRSKNSQPLHLPSSRLTFGETSNMSRLAKSSQALQSDAPVLVDPLPLLEDLQLPEAPIILALFETYFQNFHGFLPIVDKHKVLYWDPQETHHATLITNEGMRSELVFAMLALAIPHNRDSQIKARYSDAQFLSRASLAAILSLQSPTLATVQGLVLIGFGYVNSGQMSLANAFSGTSNIINEAKHSG